MAGSDTTCLLGSVHPPHREGVARPKWGMDLVVLQTASDFDIPTGFHHSPDDLLATPRAWRGSHTASKTRFFSSDSASLFFSSLFSRSSSFSRRASLISNCPNCRFHRWKLTSDRLCYRHTSWIVLPLSASLKIRILSSVVYRLPLVWVLLLAQTNTSGGSKKRSHVTKAKKL